MENWSDIGIILKIEKKGEKGNLLNVLTNNHGRYMGWFNNFNKKQYLKVYKLDNLFKSIGWNSIYRLNSLSKLVPRPPYGILLFLHNGAFYLNVKAGHLRERNSYSPMISLGY